MNTRTELSLNDKIYTKVLYLQSIEVNQRATSKGKWVLALIEMELLVVSKTLMFYLCDKPNNVNILLVIFYIFTSLIRLVVAWLLLFRWNWVIEKVCVCLCASFLLWIHLIRQNNSILNILSGKNKYEYQMYTISSHPWQNIYAEQMQRFHCKRQICLLEA